MFGNPLSKLGDLPGLFVCRNDKSFWYLSLRKKEAFKRFSALHIWTPHNLNFQICFWQDFKIDSMKCLRPRVSVLKIGNLNLNLKTKWKKIALDKYIRICIKLYSIRLWYRTCNRDISRVIYLTPSWILLKSFVASWSP
jgi:hypothetical protein